MNDQSLGGAIYLNNVDDYNNGLSQSCINPIFTSKEDIRSPTDVRSTSDNHSTTTNLVRPNIQQHSSVVRSRRSRRPWTTANNTTDLTKTTVDSGVVDPPHSMEPAGRRNDINGHVATSINNSTNISDVVTATIADCLACSGCITTAETILLQEKYSLDKLKEHLFLSYPTNKLVGEDDAMKVSEEWCAPKQKPTVVTISPASIADLCRYLLYNPERDDSTREHDEPATTATESSTQQREKLLLQLTTVLFRYLNVSAVMDGTVTLHTTLQVAAEEFCQTFHTNNSNQQENEFSVPKDEVYEQQLMPSVALSSQLTQYWIPPSVNGDDKGKSKPTVEVIDRSKCTKRVRQSLPILSSSCPAIVCLVEKSYPTMVSHLSTTVSPMIAAARQFWNPVVPILVNEPTFTSHVPNNVDVMRTTSTNDAVEFYHLAVMPCHDKKLEASRNDFRVPHLPDGRNTASTRPIVDMVITTMELLQLLHDAITLNSRDIVANSSKDNNSSGNITGNSTYDIVRQTILSVPIAPPDSNEHMPIIIDCTALVTCHFQRATKSAFEERLQQQVQDHIDHGRPYLFCMANMQTLIETATRPTTLTRAPLNVTGSGGYADYIFRYAAKQIFGLECPNDSSIWMLIVDEVNLNQHHGNNPINMGTSDMMSQGPRRMSVRTANHRKQREYYEAIIFQNKSTHHCYVATSLTSSTAMRNDCTIVLRFVIAYGMSLVQSVLSKLTHSEDSATTQHQSTKQLYDYIECMACAHSCLNGNGQISSNSNETVVTRETPSDIKLRVQRTQKYFPIQQHHVTASEAAATGDNNADTMMTTSENVFHDDPSFYTRYHIVPPMQHTMGVAAGIAVQDTQW